MRKKKLLINILIYARIERKSGELDGNSFINFISSFDCVSFITK